MKVFTAALFSLLPLLTACGVPAPGAFYQTPALAGMPAGKLISAAPLAPAIPGAASYRVLYNSTDIDGRIVPVSGVVFIPLGPPPAGGRNVVAWAHATTGIAPGCAPSLAPGPDVAASIPGLASFISAGDVVAATDYQGMGVPGVHPYLVGESEGRGVLDSVRAARTLPGANISGNFVVWGHSQGGQSALFAGQLAASYAPELHLLGVAAAAPVTDMKGEFAEPFSGDSGRLLGAYTYYSWSKVYHVPITTVVYPQAVPRVDHAAAQCLNNIGQAIAAIRAGAALNPVFLSHVPVGTPPWTALFEQNSAGLMPPGAPLLIVQGKADTTVEPYWARGFVGKVCGRHEIVDYVEYKGVSHLRIADRAAPVVTAWIADRFAGKTPPDNCKDFD